MAEPVQYLPNHGAKVARPVGREQRNMVVADLVVSESNTWDVSKINERVCIYWQVQSCQYRTRDMIP